MYEKEKEEQEKDGAEKEQELGEGWEGKKNKKNMRNKSGRRRERGRRVKEIIENRGYFYHFIYCSGGQRNFEVCSPLHPEGSLQIESES